jgi:iron-sulfur cluster repair protein YtfE (RIC family)
MDLQLKNPVDDAELTKSLADVMSHLRCRSYGAVAGLVPDALQGSGDAFIDMLARHLLYEEQVLFPELRRLDPGIAPRIRSLQAEHADLRRLATDLACAIKGGDMTRAYDVARTFLADLYSHIEHEADVTDDAHKDV